MLAKLRQVVVVVSATNDKRNGFVLRGRCHFGGGRRRRVPRYLFLTTKSKA
jgi:hypothetical protein